MVSFSINPDRIEASAQDLKNIKNKLYSLKADTDSVRLAGIMETSESWKVVNMIRLASDKILDEAVRMDSLSSALAYAVTQYRNAENAVISSSAAASGSMGDADNRSWWDKFWDWLTGKDKEEHEPTALEREQAADNALRSALRDELRDYKYSWLHWTFASVDERKKILQDYMTAVIAIYGLQHVNPNIVWDNERTDCYGYYTPSERRVYLSEKVLNGDISYADSYELLGTVAHELRHAYQHEAIENPSAFTVSEETLEAWRNNYPGYGQYISYQSDPDGYWNQPIERDARSFEVDRPVLGIF